MVGTLFKPLSHICFFSLQHSYVLARNETHDPNAGHLRNIAELTHDHLSACGFRGFHDSFGCKNPWKAKFAIFLEVLLHDMKVSILLHLPPKPDVRGCRDRARIVQRIETPTSLIAFIITSTCFLSTPAVDATWAIKVVIF